MTCDELPVGPHPKALKFNHFPTPHQAVIWRNWGLVPAARLAQVLGASEADVLRRAEEMGLPPSLEVSGRWLDRSYVTIIRNNWHLLPYQQLLSLLGWTAERLDFVLLEEDFLWHKLGDLKPDCDAVSFAELTSGQKAETERIKKTVQDCFPDIQKDLSGFKPFGFIDDWNGDARDSEEKPSVTPRRDPFDLKFLYSYSAGYGDALGGETVDPYPESLLREYAKYGINGIWLQAILYTLHPFEKAPEFSAGYEVRLANLNALVKKAARYGIGVYLYLNEPRRMPDSFFTRYPEWQGVRSIVAGEEQFSAMCTSAKGVRDYLEEACYHVFHKTPGLAGVFTITMSENLTNCHSRGYGNGCPRCGKRPPEEIIAEANAAIERGVHRAAPSANVLASMWAWADEWKHKAIDLLPKSIQLMCVSEWGLPTTVGGIKGSVVDYSISQPGPSEASSECWRRAHARGMKTVAKVQLNNSWECSVLPYLPVPYLVKEHLDNLVKAGVGGLMMSWTLGGYPGGNFELLSRTPEELAEEKFGSAVAAKVCEAWRRFGEAFREFPFHVSVLYNGQHNPGPANLLFAAATGYQASMVGYPYDDLDGWRAIYPADVFEEQFRLLSEKWSEGLSILSSISGKVSPENAASYRELVNIATATWCHFKSAHLQARFIRLRNAAPNDAELKEMRAILGEEKELAARLYAIAKNDSRIGFEATNHYLYTLNDLAEKVLNCEHLLRSCGGEKA